MKNEFSTDIRFLLASLDSLQGQFEDCSDIFLDPTIDDKMYGRDVESRKKADVILRARGHVIEAVRALESYSPSWVLKD